MTKNSGLNFQFLLEIIEWNNFWYTHHLSLSSSGRGRYQSAGGFCLRVHTIACFCVAWTLERSLSQRDRCAKETTVTCLFVPSWAPDPPPLSRHRQYMETSFRNSCFHLINLDTCLLEAQRPTSLVLPNWKDYVEYNLRKFKTSQRSLDLIPLTTLDSPKLSEVKLQGTKVMHLTEKFPKHFASSSWLSNSLWKLQTLS